jgi:hypothetical protein
MRFHPVRGVVIMAAAVAIWATYQVWIWIAGVGGVKGHASPSLARRTL